MPDDATTGSDLTALADRVRSAMESGDPAAMRGLLDAGARWGAPDQPAEFDCHGPDQVLAWWARAQAGGARAAVTEVQAGDGALLVGVSVTGTAAADEAGGTAERWQVLTVRDGRIADIRGFDNRATAAARAGLPGSTRSASSSRP